MLLRRREVVAALAAVPLTGAAAGVSQLGFAESFQALERRSGGRLGVAVRDTASRRRLDWRSGERFPMCSTFKMPTVAFVLARVDAAVERLDRQIAVPASGLLSNSPATTAAAGRTLSLDEICAAAVTLSDNSAANLILASFGGPAALTEFMRGAGDPTTRLDRIEPGLNEGLVGDPRDTTTPAAMVELWQRLLLRTRLSLGSRGILREYLVANRTGATKLRAGLPSGWRVGDKTGSWSGNGTSNDVAIAWPLGRAPILIAVYLTGSTLDDAGRSGIIADVGRIVTTL